MSMTIYVEPIPVCGEVAYYVARCGKHITRCLSREEAITKLLSVIEEDEAIVIH